MKKVVLISGKQGSGKTTIANRVLEELWGQGYKAVRIKFADVLYEMHHAVRSILRRHGVDELNGIDGALLQVLGTEWGRKTRDEDLWVRCMRTRVVDYWNLNPDGIVIVDDCRFENEFRAFEYEPIIDVTQVRLFAPKATRKLRASKWRENDLHISETGLDHLVDDYFSIVSDTSLESIESVTRRIVDELLKKRSRPSIVA